MAAGRADLSLADSVRYVELDSLSASANLHLGWHYLFAGQLDQAITQLRKTAGMDPNLINAREYLGVALELRNLQKEALTDYLRSRSIAGAKPESLAEHERAFERRAHAQVCTGVDPVLAGLRNEPRFAAILKRMGTGR